MILYTIGYQGTDVEKLVETLIFNHVEVLLDIRENPISRKPGFSKKALVNTCSQNGLEYIHIRELGCPRTIRQKYRQTNDTSVFLSEFLSYLEGQKPVLKSTSEIVAAKNCCLLCFEANHLECHRTIVADHLQSVVGPDLSVIHLVPAAKE